MRAGRLGPRGLPDGRLEPGRGAAEPGDRVTRSGRAYRVMRTRARVGEEGEADATRYVHLTSELP